jgi:hypothetical protein
MDIVRPWEGEAVPKESPVAIKSRSSFIMGSNVSAAGPAAAVIIRSAEVILLIG